jgi:hypothetical protein
VLFLSYLVYDIFVTAVQTQEEWSTHESGKVLSIHCFATLLISVHIHMPCLYGPGWFVEDNLFMYFTFILAIKPTKYLPCCLCRGLINLHSYIFPILITSDSQQEINSSCEKYNKALNKEDSSKDREIFKYILNLPDTHILSARKE